MGENMSKCKNNQNLPMSVSNPSSDIAEMNSVTSEFIQFVSLSGGINSTPATQGYLLVEK